MLTIFTFPLKAGPRIIWKTGQSSSLTRDPLAAAGCFSALLSKVNIAQHSLVNPSLSHGAQEAPELIWACNQVVYIYMFQNWNLSITDMYPGLGDECLQITSEFIKKV